jgi:hypothetical protein
MTFQDRAGRDIEVGDIIAYTASAGQRVSGIETGVVTRFSRKSLWVQDVDPETYKVLIVDDVVYEDDLSKPYTRHDGSVIYSRKRVVVGKKQVDETIVSNPKPHRFLILRKI